jgi:hypothetical protein
VNQSDKDILIKEYSNAFHTMQEGLVYSDNIIQTLKIMVFEILIPELSREIRNELTELSENYVIKQCQ